MNYNSTSGGRSGFGRKIKRVSDVNAMGYTPFDPNIPQQSPYANMGPPPVETMSQYPSPTDNYNNMNSPYMNQGIDMPSTPMNTQYNVQQYNMPNTDLNQMTPGMGAFKQPIVQDFALQYGQQLANVGTTIIQNEVGKYVPVGKLKYYFSVDTKYVLSKLLLLFFPFTHSNWSIKYEQDNPVQPRFEINAPDLYIPMMAYITYILVAGVVIGTQHDKFTFEQIGLLSSSALAWCALEICVYLATLYVSMIKTSLRTLDLLAYGGYKFVGMIVSLTAYLLTNKTGYYVTLAYTNFALAFFLVRSLKAQVLTEGAPQETAGYYGGEVRKSGGKRRLYFLLFVALTQPALSWWLSFHLIGVGGVKKDS